MFGSVAEIRLGQRPAYRWTQLCYEFGELPFEGGEIAVCAEVELDRIAMVVDGVIQIKPRAFDLYISLVEVPSSRDLTLPPIEAVKQLGAEMQNPTMDRRMIQRDAALSHQLLQIAQAQIISQIPSHT